jgi:hypothetical protein
MTQVCSSLNVASLLAAMLGSDEEQTIVVWFNFNAEVITRGHKMF